MIVSLKELPAGSLIVQSVQSDSSLASQDVKQGDLITKVNGKDLDSADDLPDLIDKSAVGDTLTLTICRIDSNYNINEFEVKATLVEGRFLFRKDGVHNTQQLVQSVQRIRLRQLISCRSTNAPV